MDISLVIDSGFQEFQRDAVDASAERLVLVDFWAAWCGPCRTLGPILEKIVGEYSGAVRLVKIDTDKEQALAAQFGVRSLPTVLILQDGEVVDQFMGAQPESAIRQKIDQFVSNPFDLALEEARTLHSQGDTAAARQILDQLIAAGPTNDAPKLLLIDWLSADDDLEGASSVAETLSPEGRNSAEFRAYHASLEFHRDASELPSQSELEENVSRNPDDLDCRYKLAKLLVARQAYPEAMDHLLEIIRRDRKFEDDGARKTMLKVFELLGGKGELVSDYRSRLSRILF